MGQAMQSSDLYRLLNWFLASFPVGAYAYSHGLEYAATAGLVDDRALLQEWVHSIIRDGSGRVDSALLCAAYRAVGAAAGSQELSAVSELAAALRGTSELARESLTQGGAFLATVRASWPYPELDRWVATLERQRIEPAYPVAVALVCAVKGIPLEPAVTAYLHAFAAALVSAGVRLIPLGQTDGQRVLAALEEPVLTAVQEALHCPLENIGSATPMVDWTSMQHETQPTRLFRS
jgi:urease accessory protein